MDYQKIIDHYYKEDTPLRHILLLHSRQVADRALLICDRHPEFGLDREFVEAAAMLHDIGIVRCNAPSIHCHGTEPYIRHGLLGAEMLRQFGQDTGRDDVEPFARVCERHTGAGIAKDEIVEQGLPLPQRDFTPETLAEKVICYADKFYSKSRPDHEKTIDEAMRSLSKFGDAGVGRFKKWVEMFE